jgi:branched-chain amino acid transport system substrate-binding protein
MRKGLCVATLLAVTLLSTPTAQAHQASGPIKIAAVLTLSGPWAYLGVSELKGLQLGVEQINRRGGVLSHRVELAYEDDGGDPKTAGDIARRLATPESADVLIGGSRSQTSIAIAAVAERARIPFVALGASSRISAQRRWVFQTSPIEGPAVRRILADMKKRGIGRIALLSEDSEFGQTGRHEVQDATHPQGLGIRTYGVHLGFDAVYQPTEASIAAQLGPLATASTIDAILVYGAGDGPVLVLRQLRNLGIKLPVYQSHGIAAYEFLRLAGDAAEGVRLASPPVLAADLLPADDPRKARLAEFVAAFHARFGELPSSFAGYAYDAVTLGIEAIRRATSADFESVRRAMELTQGMVGITGTYRMWPDNHAGLDDKALLLLEVKDGAFRIAD